MLHREDFLLNEIENKNSENNYNTLFTKMKEVEESLNKNVEEISSREDLMHLISVCCGEGTYNSINSNLSLLKKYYEYIGNDVFKLLRKQDLKEILDSSKEHNKYISKESLMTKIEGLNNFSDKCLLMLLRNYIGHEKEVKDLIELKISDINFKEGTVYGRKVDDYTMFLIGKTIKEKEYISNGLYDKIIIYNMNSPYLFKTRRTKSTCDGLFPFKASGIRGRLQRIKQEIKDEDVILTNLLLSYIIDSIIEYQNNIGKELTLFEIKDYLNREFGITKNIYNIKRIINKVLK